MFIKARTWLFTMLKYAVPTVFFFLSLGCAQQASYRSEPIELPADRNYNLTLCENEVSNAPSNDGRRIFRGSPYACLQGKKLLIAPAPAACLSSGFGPRGKRLHKGLDYQSNPAGDVVAAAAGVILEMTYRRKDMGNWIVISHGGGVYSAYAHLAQFNPALKPGKKVKMGQVLGTMGDSGGATKAVHLHYEVRTGNFYAPGGWWVMEPINLFNTPQSC